MLARNDLAHLHEKTWPHVPWLSGTRTFPEAIWFVMRAFPVSDYSLHQSMSTILGHRDLPAAVRLVK